MANQEESTHVQTEPVPADGAASVPTGADGIAAALALEQAKNEPELAADLRGYLRDQRGLADVQRQYLGRQMKHLDVQMEHLHGQRHLTLSHMRYQHFNDWLSSAWRVLLVILGTGVVGVASWLLWDARHDRGLVMEAFHVPEDLAAKGYTGTVVAERVLDHLKALQADSTGNRASSSYTLNWGENLKVEIPETGVSLGELKNFLHENLGKQTRISGEIVHTDSGLAIQVRAGEESGERIEGTESELDALAERAAEKIYAQTQPYRYASVLAARGRPEEGVAVLRALAANSKFPATERAWAYQALSYELRTTGDFEQAKRAALEAIRLDPSLFDGYLAASAAEGSQGHYEVSAKYGKQALELLRSQRTRADVEPAMMESFVFYVTCAKGAAGVDVDLALKSCQGGDVNVFALGGQVAFETTIHDISSARATLESAEDPAMVLITAGATAGYEPTLAGEDWPMAAKRLADMAQDPRSRANELNLKSALAYATARLGDIDAAQKLIDATPIDCYPCVRTRGKIAALKKDWPTAEHWFAEAAKQGPSLPFANMEWGEMLLTKGDIDGAIVQCQEAVKRQPHFADPYQYWGEALLLKGDARGAIKQFEQAVKYAPKWGRIQIQWGAALKKLGRNAEAQKKFAAAEALELVPSERALLTAAKI